MDYNTDTATITIKVRVDTDLETDRNGTLNVVSYVYGDDDEDGTELRTEFETIIENIIEFYESSEGAQPLYSMAHELARMAERLRAVANALEGQMSFEFDPEDYDQLPMDD